VAFINWISAEGEQTLAGTLSGFADEEQLRAAAEACTVALNSILGPWE
jgi:hypothetical protein